LKEMALTGAQLSAERAYQLGFLNAVAEDPMTAVDALVARIAATAPQATETAKWMISAALSEGGAAAVEALAGAAMASTEEKAEGVAAFSEKRKPSFETAP
ncbi:MAG: enoyl-CoA hydratase-related protein, partial [Pseudomonadota bacterium]